ncbi:MAG: RNA-binding S4 domain-containing protein [Lachnospiraceae bacterium]|nr:RNA-binding S4 domain-containing protein [Lachnospiraceae bacterium]
MITITLREEFIKLGQALKAANLVGSGLEAKIMINQGKVLVNGAVETQRGKKLYDGDMVTFNGETISIKKAG